MAAFPVYGRDATLNDLSNLACAVHDFLKERRVDLNDMTEIAARLGENLSCHILHCEKLESHYWNFARMLQDRLLPIEQFILAVAAAGISPKGIVQFFVDQGIKERNYD